MDPNSAASEQFRNAVDAAVDGYLLRHPSPAAIVCGLDAWKLLRKPSIWRGCFVVPDPIMPAMQCYVVGQHERITVSAESGGQRVVCRIEIPGVERDGSREVGLSAKRTADLLGAVSKAWPGVWFRGSWPGIVDFGVTEPDSDGSLSDEG